MDLSAILKQSVGSVTVEDVLSAVLTLVVCLVLVRILMKVLTRLTAKSTLDARVRKYLLSGVRMLLYIVTAVIVAESLNIPMTSLVALLSVGSLGVTLAAEDVLGNMAGGLVLLSSRPFSIGDFVEVSGTSGTVEEIGLNHTKLVTVDGHRVMLPNKELASSKMTNFTVLGRRRAVQKVNASYDTPTAAVKAACMEAIAALPQVLEDPEPGVYLSQYGSSSIEYTVFCWTDAQDYWATYLALGEGLRESFAAHGVEMTYDHLNVHLVDRPS